MKKFNYKILIFVVLGLLTSVAIIGCGSSSDDHDFATGDNDDSGDDLKNDDDDIDLDNDNDQDPNVDNANKKVWTVEQILAEPRSGGFGGVAECGGEFGFKRCICPDQVPSSIRYRPAVVECNGNAAAILHDDYNSAFSVVVRDSQNRDRWPAAGSGFGGCSASLADSEAPPNSCSAFKVQNKFSILGGTAKVHCFGASGYSSLFSDAVRLTVKLDDHPLSSDDPLERFCLRAGDEPLN